jgi:outer membrane murein-binding lipoprotein Lpp
MRKKVGLVAALVVGASSLAGCFTLDYDHNVSLINKLGRDVKDLHALTEKCFFNYDASDPFMD